VDIHQPVETAIMLLGHELKHGIKLVRDFSELPPVSANPGELSQVFMNVMMNGIQAMGETGELHISSYRDNGMAVVRFQDTGKGIPTSCRDRIFEPFYTTKEVGKGTGLGLAISYGIVQAHHGEIEVESTGDKGTAIVVRIPLAETDKKAGEG
jgi:signal transduction histidine kinase